MISVLNMHKSYQNWCRTQIKIPKVCRFNCKPLCWLRTSSHFLCHFYWHFYSELQSTLFHSPKLLFVHLFNDNSGKSRKWNIGSYVRYKNNLQPWTVILNRCSIWKLAPAVYILWDGQYSDSFYHADKCSVNISIMIKRFHEYLFKTIKCIRMSQKVF